MATRKVTVNETTILDLTDATRTADKILQGFTAYIADGSKVTGTASGGGSGYTYETGTYTPTSDTARPTISFANSHTTTPFMVAMVDTSAASGITSNSNTMFCFFDPWRMFSSGYPYSTSATRYANAYYTYRSSNGSSVSGVQTQYNSDNTSSSSTSYSRYWVTASAFNPYTNSSSRYWRANRTYKWVAVWKR